MSCKSGIDRTNDRSFDRLASRPDDPGMFMHIVKSWELFILRYAIKIKVSAEVKKWKVKVEVKRKVKMRKYELEIKSYNEVKSQ